MYISIRNIWYSLFIILPSLHGIRAKPVLILFVSLSLLLLLSSSKMAEDSSSKLKEQEVPAQETSTKNTESKLALHNSDHPGMQLVSTPLIDSNYLTWSRSMVIALKAKDKLAFINGKCEMPDSRSEDYDKWQRVDNMVTSWLLNSISKDIVDAFLYVCSARELWEEIKGRFGESNGPLLYQLKREISSFTQADMTVIVYFTKLKKLWDELTCLKSLPVCTCGKLLVIWITEID